MRALRSVVVLALVLTGCLRLDVFVFRPKPAPEGAGDLMATSRIPADLRQELVDEIVSEDGVKVSAWMLSHRPDDGTPAERHGRALLYCHGNNTHIGTTVPRLDALWELGYSVLVFDARGFGKTELPSTGQTEEGVYADARAARAYLETLHVPERIALYGRSLGSAICLRLATEKAAALVLESPIAALQTIIDDSVAIDTPADWYVDSSMDNPATAEAFEGALLVMHGTEDDYVRPEYGEAIHDRATKASSRELWLVPGATHGTVPCVDHSVSRPDNDCEGGFSDDWKSRTTGFLDAHLP